MLHFENLLELATSPSQNVPDEEITDELCNLIWELRVNPKISLQAIHTKITDENPAISYNGLLVLEKVFYKCGNFIHGPICTPTYMTSLKKVINLSKHKKVKDKILELLLDWSDKFEYLHHFNKPIENLLSQLRNNHGSVSLDEIERPQNDDKEKKFKKDLLEITKERFKEHCKKHGLPTSSDEDSVEENDNACFNFQQQKEFFKEKLNSQKQTSHQESLLKNLPVEMQKNKESRLHVKNSIEEYKNSKKLAYYAGINNHVDLKQCLASNCEDCMKNKTRIQPEESREKRWPREIQKIKESKAHIKESLEQYRELNKKTYNDKKLFSG